MSMADPPTVGSPLTVEQQRAVEHIVGAPVEVAEVVWERDHVLRVRFRGGHTAIVKRPRDTSTDARARFETELGNLEYLSPLSHGPGGLVPALLGADQTVGVLVMENIPPGPSLAHALLGDDPAAAERHLLAYARALGRIHRWSFEHPPPATLKPWPPIGVEDSAIESIAVAATRVGVAFPPEAAVEVRQVFNGLRDGGAWHGFVHGDGCPDNTVWPGERLVVFDFEHSGRGSVLIDASYLVAPFPTCWCFAPLPDAVSRAAVLAYRDEVGAHRPDFEEGLAAATAFWVLTRGEVIVNALGVDRTWGTTGIRLRLLRWLGAAIACAIEAATLPTLVEVFSGLRAALADEWPTAAVAYPAWSSADVAPVEIPSWWSSTI